ncbi:MAG: GNAT family N-acetyltransferase [Candidatus Paracaedibacteraceae bacterium]|nr:GNAT family N-acetyltransferase [Candidatus Paracaedibacteraceae bacterium]
MQRYIPKIVIYLTFFLSLSIPSHAVPCQQEQNAKKLHEWAVQSHREFWTMVGRMAGYESRDELEYQYVRSTTPTGLNYAYISKGYKNSDFVINMLKDRVFTIFFEEDDDEHIFQYITLLRESDDFITMGLDLKKLNPIFPLKNGVKVWKINTDAEFEQWLQVTASRRNSKEDQQIRQYFENFKPSKNNPTISFYLGSINNQVVGSSLIYFSADFASLYWVGVHPQHRRHGLGTALSYVPLQEAINKGYRWSVLQAQPLGVPVYPRLGFKKVGRMKVFYYIPPRY